MPKQQICAGHGRAVLADEIEDGLEHDDAGRQNICTLWLHAGKRLAFLERKRTEPNERALQVAAREFVLVDFCALPAKQRSHGRG